MGGAAFAPLQGDQDEQRALDVLVTAFVADPVIRWMFPDASRYLTRFPAFLRAFGGRAFASRTAFRLGEFEAVALWFPPLVEPEAEPVLAEVRRSVPPDRHADLLEVLEQMDRAHPTFPHWYLPWFGVDGGQQGRGIGSALMERCLEFVDEAHLPAYLETPNARNISFYERHEFEVTGTSQAGACPPLYSMLRSPR